MHIGILQSGHFPEELVPEHGTYPDLYARLLDGHGFTFQTWSVVDGQFPGSVTDADGWLISGSKHGAYEDLPWIPTLEAFIRKVHTDGRPMVGICFGHQIIAQALGGKVAKFEGGWSVGHTVYDIDGEDVALNAWHQDQVVERPENAEVVGTSEICKYAALAYGNSIYTLQPHPEFSDAAIDGLIRIRGGAIPRDIVAAATAKLPEPTKNAYVGNQLAEFFLKHRER